MRTRAARQGREMKGKERGVRGRNTSLAEQTAIRRVIFIGDLHKRTEELDANAIPRTKPIYGTQSSHVDSSVFGHQNENDLQMLRRFCFWMLKFVPMVCFSSAVRFV